MPTDRLIARVPLPSLALLASVLLFLLPAFLGLARRSWQSEAGSLAPLVLALGGWTIWRSYRANQHLRRPGLILIWVPAIATAIAVYVFASAIEFVPLMAVAAWAGGICAFYALFGGAVVIRSAFPLLFVGLVIPLPYSLSMGLNAQLRSWLAEQSVAVAAALGLDVALEHGAIAVDQYILSVENACAGANSTLSLVAIGLLYAHWVMDSGWRKIIALMLLALPIALCANIGRVVVLMALVGTWGSSVLDTALHPLSGLISFTIALALLVSAARLIGTRGKGSGHVHAT